MRKEDLKEYSHDVVDQQLADIRGKLAAKRQVDVEMIEKLLGPIPQLDIDPHTPVKEILKKGTELRARQFHGMDEFTTSLIDHTVALLITETQQSDLLVGTVRELSEHEIKPLLEKDSQVIVVKKLFGTILNIA